MSPNEIAERMIQIGKKSYAPPDINCIVLRWHYLSDAEDKARPSSEGAYGTKDQVQFFLSTHRQFISDLVEEVLIDCITTMESAEISGSPEDVRSQLITAIRKRFDMITQ